MYIPRSQLPITNQPQESITLPTLKLVTLPRYILFFGSLDIFIVVVTILLIIAFLAILALLLKLKIYLRSGHRNHSMDVEKVMNDDIELGYLEKPRMCECKFEDEFDYGTREAEETEELDEAYDPDFVAEVERHWNSIEEEAEEVEQDSEVEDDSDSDSELEYQFEYFDKEEEERLRLELVERLKEECGLTSIDYWQV